MAGLFGDLFGTVLDAVLLVGLPLLYLVSSYLALSLPARWIFGREPVTLMGVGLLLGSLVVGFINLARTLQQMPPVAPVSPRFARAMFALSWVLALLLTVADLAG